MLTVLPAIGARPTFFYVRQLVHLQLDGSYTLNHPMVALVLFAKDGGQVLPSGIRGVNRLRSHRVKTMSVALAAKMGLNHSS